MIIVPVSLDPNTGTPIVPDEIKQRVRNGERISIEILPQVNGFAKNALRHGVAGLNVDGTRIPIAPDDKGGWRPNCYDKEYEYDNEGNFLANMANGKVAQQHPQGRWPSNVLLDEESAALLDEQSGERKGATSNSDSGADARNTFNKGWTGREKTLGYADTGGASRFFYVAKASKSDRGEGNTHNTVKPIELMKYLCRLTKTPWGGVVLDPFCGSGSTGVAAVLEGRSFIGIDISAEYLAIAEARLAAASAQPFLFEVT